jgi:hypothetical protein
MYLVVGRVISEAAAKELKRRGPEQPGDKKDESLTPPAPQA